MWGLVFLPHTLPFPAPAVAKGTLLRRFPSTWQLPDWKGQPGNVGEALRVLPRGRGWELHLSILGVIPERGLAPSNHPKNHCGMRLAALGSLDSPSWILLSGSVNHEAALLQPLLVRYELPAGHGKQRAFLWNIGLGKQKGTREAFA